MSESYDSFFFIYSGHADKKSLVTKYRVCSSNYSFMVNSVSIYDSIETGTFMGVFMFKISLR